MLLTTTALPLAKIPREPQTVLAITPAILAKAKSKLPSCFSCIT